MNRYMTMSPEGARDYLFEDCASLERAARLINSAFEGRAYHRVMTPTMEFYDLFAAPCVGIDATEMYKLVDGKGRILALRADSTAPIARLAAGRLRDYPGPIRLYYDQPVFKTRALHSALGNETRQAGVELIGAGDGESDLEILSLAAATCRLFSPQFRLEIGHMGYFEAVSAELPMSAAERAKLRALLEQKSFACIPEVLEKYRDCAAYAALSQLPRLFGGAEVLDRARALFSCPRSDAILDYLKGVYESLKEINPDDRVIIDLSLMQRNDYYTGIMFSCYMDDAPAPVLSGGRYDGLLANFGAPMCAVGFGADVGLLAKTFAAAPVAPPDLLVCANRSDAPAAIRAREELVRTGQCALLAIGVTGEQADSYAKSRGIARILEAAGGKITERRVD